jgi:hypothetical protein
MQISSIAAWSMPTKLKAGSLIQSLPVVQNTPPVVNASNNLQLNRFHGLDKVGFDLGEFLSSNTRGALIEMTQGANPQSILNGSVLGSPVTDREWVARTIIEQSQSVVQHGTLSASIPPTNLTDSDFAFLKEATGGYNLVYNPDGSSFWVDDNGNLPQWSDEEARQWSQLEAQMDTDRRAGTLKGDISVGYLQTLFAQAKQNGQAFSQAFMDELFKHV